MSVSHKVNGTWQKTAGLPPVDSALSSTSQNPLENRQIYAALADKITASVSNLVNYYKKSETYTQAEVRQLIGAISTLSIKVVAALPTSDISATTIYWVGPDATTGKYDQYIYSNNAWVKTGDTSVNLGDYVTTEALELAIADFLTEDDIEVILANYYTKTEVDTLLNDKQDSLTFDNVPTENSSNVVKSGGVYSTVDDVYEVMGKNGAKNLLPYPFYGNSTKTLNGITFTDNGDGTVTANGTATADADFYPFFAGIGTKKLVTLPAGKYTISGCPSGGSSTSYYIYISLWNGAHTGGVTKGFDYGEGFELTLDEETELRGFIVRVVNGQAVSNLTFKPMIRLASDTDSTYQPYAMTNQQITPYIQAISNPNLLDNPWFTVNQRGQSTYASATANRWCLDRWRFTTTLDVVVNSDTTITVTNTSSSFNWFGQQFVLQERGLNEGTVVTQSIMLSNGTIYSFTAPIPSGTNLVDKNIQENGIEKIRIQQLNGGIYHAVIFISANSSATIRAVKLELGTISTLANDTAPNYQQELAKCQRYFVRLGYPNGSAYEPIGVGFAKSANQAYIYGSLPTEMRQSPSITLSGKVYCQSPTKGLANAPCGTLHTSTNRGRNGYILYLTPDTENVFTLGEPLTAYFVQTSAGTNESYIDFSADL